MIEVNKQWSTWIILLAGLFGSIALIVPSLSLPEPWPNIILISSAALAYIAKHIKQKPKSGGSDA